MTAVQLWHHVVLKELIVLAKSILLTHGGWCAVLCYGQERCHVLMLLQNCNSIIPLHNLWIAECAELCEAS